MEFKDSAYHIPWFIVGARSNLELAKGVHVIPLELLLVHFTTQLKQHSSGERALSFIISTNEQVSYVLNQGNIHRLPNGILGQVYAHAKEIFITLGLIDPEKEEDF